MEMYFATGLLDLVAQVTREATQLNGRNYVIDKYLRILESIIAFQAGLSRWNSFRSCLEEELGILITFE